MRETLFNWLSPVINNANCADLFAGSGALGLEALSRGAKHCDFVDNSTQATAQIRNHLATLAATELATCYTDDAERYLARTTNSQDNLLNSSLDIVFIDPPFHRDLVVPTCLQLEASAQLAANAMIYIETPAAQTLTELPPNWHLHREKITGGVACRLYTAGAA